MLTGSIPGRPGESLETAGSHRGAHRETLSRVLGGCRAALRPTTNIYLATEEERKKGSGAPFFMRAPTGVCQVLRKN